MSIINDALKKAQKHLSAQKTASKPALEPNSSNTPEAAHHIHPKASSSVPRPKAEDYGLTHPSASHKSAFPAAPALLVLINVTLVAGIIYLIYINTLNELPGAATAPSVTKGIAPGKTGAENLESTTERKTSPLQTKVIDGISLTGTMSSGGKMTALINGKIYEIGDLIENKEIINIDLNGITLRLPDGVEKSYKVRDFY